MTIFFIAVCMLCLWKMKFTKPLISGMNEYYLDMNRTNSMKGIFILLVFLSHARNCISMLPQYTSDPLNSIYDVFQNHLGQGIVVMFLFYSGYGVMESVKKKGEHYIKQFPKKRFAKTLFNFDLAVILFIIVDQCLGILKDYSVPKVILSFTGWESVGNSNWYIFAILILYLITYVAFKIFKDKYSKAAVLVTVLTVVYIAVLSFFKVSWWFDTVILYPLGIWYSIGKEKIEAFIRKKLVNYWILFMLSVFVFIFSHIFRSNILIYELSQVSLCAVIVCVTIKVDINNKMLEFFGSHLFEIYILMRIPMIVLLQFNLTNTYLFVTVSFIVTVILAVLFKRFLSYINNKMFSGKVKHKNEF